jgi:DHA2 family multidrug resistance protein
VAWSGSRPEKAGQRGALLHPVRHLRLVEFVAFVDVVINEHVSLLEPATRNRLADLQQYFMSHGFPDPAGALHRAIIAVGQTIRTQATIMGPRGLAEHQIQKDQN